MNSSPYVILAHFTELDWVSDFCLMTRGGSTETRRTKKRDGLAFILGGESLTQR